MLEDGTKIHVTQADGRYAEGDPWLVIRAFWSVWNATTKSFRGCYLSEEREYTTQPLDNFKWRMSNIPLRFRTNIDCMAEQLIADGSIE